MYYKQCDEIGRFFKVLGPNFPMHVAQMLRDIFVLLVKNSTFYVKLLWLPFRQLLGEIGLLFTLTSGQTEFISKVTTCYL